MQDVRWKNQKAIGHSICKMDQIDLHWPAMDQSELYINRIREHVKVADRNNPSTG